MCGIVGYTGRRPCRPLLLDGLSRLEYRGYDSAGIATLNEGRIERRRAPGKLANLAERLAADPLPGAIGIAHTRWATHGGPTEDNAHPHIVGDVSIVHNGIIENFKPLREELIADGRTFLSQTDTEVIVHLIEAHYEGDLVAAVRSALREVSGAYALVVSHAEHDLIVAARATSPMVLGLGAAPLLVFMGLEGKDSSSALRMASFSAFLRAASAALSAAASLCKVVSCALNHDLEHTSWL